ncbi:unnamed protein product [Hermetia illucens]|uniref:Uncharacterized protein n=1 Tax=Hermetia illucens TaxID=343691 RepID=A0A7R8UDI6_HERIL|nr:uncharacterized protein LOC119661586 [Hermetia illucens]CAD7078793.1 unnamed protein product [Hermetia illucens]
MYFNVLIAAIFALLVDSTLACNGYKAKIKKLESCNPDNVVKVDDGFSVKLSKKCEIIPSGCISTKGFSTAKATYSLEKDGITIKEGTVDLCEAAHEVSSEAKNLMKVFAIPDHCPVAEGKICANENTKADISKYKHMMGVARGNIVVSAKIKHDTGETCFKMEIEISK